LLVQQREFMWSRFLMLPGGLNYPHRYIRLIVLATSAERVYVEQVSDATWWAELPSQVHG
jgi:hypothetical protein